MRPAQWRLLGSARGLGIGDVEGQQRRLFAAALPDPFPLQKSRMYAGHTSSGNGEKPLVLSPQQRLATRLRLHRAAELTLATADGKGGMRLDNLRSARPGLADDTETFTMGRETGEEHLSDVYGVRLWDEVPSRPKPGHLAFEIPALNAMAPLAGAGTVGDLVRLAATSARLELHADARVAKLPVWVRGERARAGDVLRALSLAVTGTWRKVGPAAYVLTDDLVGTVARKALLIDWYRDAEPQARAQQQAAETKLLAAQPTQYVGFASDDPFALSPAVLAAFEANLRKPLSPGRPYTPIQVPLTDLSPATRAYIRDWLALMAKQVPAEGVTPRYDYDRAYVDVKLRLSYVVPDVGVVDDTGAHFYSLNARLFQPTPTFLPPAEGAPVTLPPFATRAALVAPKTADEAGRAARAACARGFTQLWVDIPATGGPDLLRAALAVGKEHGLSVCAVVALLRQPRDDAESAEAAADRNPLNETSSDYARRRAAAPGAAGQYPHRKEFYADAAGWDWLRSDTPTTAEPVKRRLAEIARTPGLAGLVLHDTAAPGYADRIGQVVPEAGAGYDFGYTQELRLAFLRQEGVDPVDLQTAYYYARIEVKPPFFPGYPVRAWFSPGPAANARAADPLARWKELRREANARLLAATFTSLRAARPDLPVLVRVGEPLPNLGAGGSGWYGSWDRADAPPALPASFDPARTAAQAARAQSRRVLLNATVQKWAGISPALSALSGVVGRDGDWDGLVLDLSGMAVDDALPLLEKLAAGSPPATK